MLGRTLGVLAIATCAILTFGAGVQDELRASERSPHAAGGGPEAPPPTAGERTEVILAVLRGEFVSLLGRHASGWLKPYEVGTSAMAPTIGAGDRVIADRLAYADGAEPRRGDVIAYRAGRSAVYTCGGARGAVFIHRVIGIPGDQVEVRAGRTLVNGVPQEIEGAAAPNQEHLFPTVPASRLIVLGDNRPSSCDSSQFYPYPFVSLEDVIGRVEGIYAPRSRVGLLRPGGGIEPIAIPDPAARRRFDFLVESTDLPSHLAQRLGLLGFCATHRSCREDVGRLMSSLAGELGGEIRRVRRVARRFGDPCTRPAGASLRAGLLRDRRALVRAKRSARGAQALVERVLARYPRLLRHAMSCE